MASWYLIRSKPRQEPIAQMHLERQGFCVFLPRVLQHARIRGRWIDRVEPLFPRYLFVEDATGRSLGPVRSTIGVADIVRFGADYARVPAEIVRRLADRANPETGLHELRKPLFTPGTRVRVAEGPFKGIEGIFECHEGAERVMILLDVLGRQTGVCMSVHQVVPQLAF
jgi:transcriptional antiterminator RfaH